MITEENQYTLSFYAASEVECFKRTYYVNLTEIMPRIPQDKTWMEALGKFFRDNPGKHRMTILYHDNVLMLDDRTQVDVHKNIVEQIWIQTPGLEAEDLAAYMYKVARREKT